MKKIKVQMVGNYYVNEIERFFPENIIVQNKLTGISPLTLVGRSDKQLIELWEPKIRDLNQYKEKPSKSVYLQQAIKLFDLKKNFPSLMSRNKENFCDNVVYRIINQNTVYENSAEYLVVEHSAAVYSLIKLNNILYTDTFPKSPFTAFLKSNAAAERFSPTQFDDFNWKYYFDKYIDAILQFYSNQKIILIKTPYNYFYNDQSGINLFKTQNIKLGNFISELDEYFAIKTGCIVIDDLCMGIPQKNSSNAYPYGTSMGDKCYRKVADRIVSIVYGKQVYDLTGFDFCYNSKIAEYLAQNLRQDKIQEKKYSSLLNIIESHRIVYADQLVKICNEQDEDFEKIISLINRFVTEKCRLCDYIISLVDCEKNVVSIQPDAKLINDYVSLFKCDINDVISLFYLYNVSDDKSSFCQIINELCKSDCSVIKKAKEIFSQNLAFLTNYDYIEKVIFENLSAVNKYIIQLCDNAGLIIDGNDTPCFQYTNELIKSDVDFLSIIENGYVCTIDCADAITYSYDYYIEKAKRGDGQKPTFLHFESKEQFYDSLFFEDYVDLLNNEKFIFTFGDNHNETFYEYIPVTNLTELLDPNLVIVSIRSGLGDQICKYIYGKVIEKYTGKKVLYETTQCVSYNGFEVQKISTERINLLSDILSKRLYKARIYKNLFLKVSESSNYITTSLDSFKGEDIALDNLSGCYLGGNNLEMYIVNSLPYQFHNTLVRVEQLMSCFNFEIRDYLKFPPFITEQHKALSSIILSCDSVIIHVRRGDHITAGFDIDNEFYVDAISEVMKLDQYSNRKFFVFSDDIPWCKANTETIGLNQIEDCELFFVEDNREGESFRDIQLMSLGKIMIIGKSYFSRVAALYNNNIEILISSSRSLSNKLALQKGLSMIVDLGSKEYQEYKEDKTPRK